MRLQLIVRHGRSPDVTYSMTPVTLWTYVALPTDLEALFHTNEKPRIPASPKSRPASSVAACYSYLSSFIIQPTNFPRSALESAIVDISVILLPRYPHTRQTLVSSNNLTPLIQHHPRVFCILVISPPPIPGNICKFRSYTFFNARELKRECYVDMKDIMTHSKGHLRKQLALLTALVSDDDDLRTDTMIAKPSSN